MEDYLSGLYQSLGLPLEAEFSSEDVTLIYHQVFHVPSSTTDACAAMQKFAGMDSSWSCVGENLLDVLLEMEREREKKEKLCWELQLLNIGNINSLSEADSPVIDADRRLSVKKDLSGGGKTVKRLQKSARQFWSRLASEGVYGIICQGQGPGVRGQAWGSIRLSDVLLLVDVKYDVVTQLLYKEMLEEHYTPSTWEGMLPWQRQKEEEDLEDLVEDALESSDMVSLAELPGAFRINSMCTGSSWRGRAESRKQCWSAVSLLWDARAFRQREKDALTKLNKSLDSGSLRLLCLYIRLATVRAQRETVSYRALLAARQSWETWPRVKSPCGAEQVTLWLQGYGGENKTDLTSASPQQALLQLLVLNQEQERDQLLSLLRDVSLEDLQDPDCDFPVKEDCQERAALRIGCIKKMKEMDSKRHDQTPTTDLQPVNQLDEWRLVLLTQLSELHEEQDSEVLSSLIDECAARVQTLRDKYESQLRTRSYSSGLRSLLSDAPRTPESPDRAAARSCGGSKAEAPISSGAPAEDLTGGGPGTGPAGAETEDETKEENICTGCGVIIEVLPYLEVLCVSDESAGPREESGAATCPQDHENQGSLITLAWGKPSEDAGTARDRLETPFQPRAASSGGERGQFEDRDDAEPTLVQSEPTGRPEGLRADEESSTFSQWREDASECDLQLYADALQASPSRLSDCPSEIEWRAGDLVSGLAGEASDLKNEAVQAERSEWRPPAPDSEPGTLEGPGLIHTKDHDSHLQVDVERSAAEGEHAATEGGGMSAVEREKTMRSLVDVQRKVERRHRRDRERQMLRVQERLSIVQSRKAERDLLGWRRPDRLTHLTQNLPQEDRYQQKTAVRERLEQLRRERSCVMQSKRDRNTAGFKELLGPEALRGSETDDGTKAAAAHLCDSLKLF